MVLRKQLYYGIRISEIIGHLILPKHPTELIIRNLKEIHLLWIIKMSIIRFRKGE